MGPKYFNGFSWDRITREERLFCAELFFHIRKDPQDFVALLQRKAHLPSVPVGQWDTSYEVCFYRDFIRRFPPKDEHRYSLKRTFDIAMFGESTIIIIEAKAAEMFSSKQAESFGRDLEHIVRLLKSKVDIYFVALASTRYFDNFEKHGRSSALKAFDSRHLTWEAVEGHYPDVPLFKRACEVYKSAAVTK